MRKKNLEGRIEDLETAFDGSKSVKFIWEGSECDKRDDNNLLHSDDRVTVYRVHWHRRNDKGTTVSV